MCIRDSIMTDLLKGTEKETMILRYTDFAERASKPSSEREVVAMQDVYKRQDFYLRKAIMATVGPELHEVTSELCLLYTSRCV